MPLDRLDPLTIGMVFLVGNKNDITLIKKQ